MKIIYHNDPDGKCAAASICYFYETVQALLSKTKLEYIAMDYNLTFPLDKIEKDEDVWIVDFSIPVDTMIKLGEITKNIVWIDHHKSALETYKDFESSDVGFELEGIRDIKYAGCELTWIYLMMRMNDMEQYGGPVNSGVSWFNKMPGHIKLIGNRDVWRQPMSDETVFFSSGILGYDLNPENKIWYNLFTRKGFKDKIIQEGEIIERYKTQWSKDYSESYSFESDFGDQKNCLICNVAKMGSDFFGELQDKYDVLIRYAMNGKGECMVSFNSTKENIDVSEIAKKYGGGGHKGASGCAMPINKFLSLIDYKEGDNIQK